MAKLMKAVDAFDTAEEALAERRPDVRAALALRSAVFDFNGEARNRNTLTLPDRRALARISELLEVFENDSRRIANGTEVGQAADTGLSSEAAKVITPTRRYVAMTEGTMNADVAGEKIAIPALESGAVRAKLHIDGQALVETVTAYVDWVATRERKKGEAWQRELDAFESALEFPAVGALVSAWEEVDREIQSAPAAAEVRYRILTNLADAISTLNRINRHKHDQRPFSTEHRDLRKLVTAWREKSGAATNTAA